jgi:GNAT superfamily N-acetyltransferase
LNRFSIYGLFSLLGVDNLLVPVNAFDNVYLLYAAPWDCQARKLWYSQNMDVRKATPNDSLLLSTLCKDVQGLHARGYPDIFKPPQSDDFAVSFFEEMQVDPAISIFIAEENGEAFGYILCKLIEHPENPITFARRYLLVDQISVRPAAQGRGVGTALIQQAELLAKELGVQRIQLDSWDFNIKAHGFFERLGFQKFIFRFWRHL